MAKVTKRNGIVVRKFEKGDLVAAEYDEWFGGKGYGVAFVIRVGVELLEKLTWDLEFWVKLLHRFSLTFRGGEDRAPNQELLARFNYFASQGCSAKQSMFLAHNAEFVVVRPESDD